MDKVKLQMPSELEQAQAQINRLQLENHNLRQTMIDEFNRYHYWQIENEKLQAENEQLKNDIETGTICVTCTKENENCRLQAENERLLSALQEIRELIKKLDLSLGCAYGDYDCDNCSDINEKTVCKIKLQNIIIDKINSVIGAEQIG